jgi:GH25 family lysozyme M1 (1,4-beta-N-acetylmuramidase)
MCDLKSEELDYLESSKWHFWQYSHTARIPGIAVEVDMNLYNGTKADFENKLISQSHN